MLQVVLQVLEAPDGFTVSKHAPSSIFQHPHPAFRAPLPLPRASTSLRLPVWRGGGEGRRREGEGGEAADQLREAKRELATRPRSHRGSPAVRGNLLVILGRRGGLMGHTSSYGLRGAAEAEKGVLEGGDSGELNEVDADPALPHRRPRLLWGGLGAGQRRAEVVGTLVDVLGHRLLLQNPVLRENVVEGDPEIGHFAVLIAPLRGKPPRVGK